MSKVHAEVSSFLFLSKLKSNTDRQVQARTKEESLEVEKYMKCENFLAKWDVFRERKSVVVGDYIKVKKVQKRAEMLLKILYALQFMKHALRFLQDTKLKIKRQYNGMLINSFVARKTREKLKARHSLDNYFRTKI